MALTDDVPVAGHVVAPQRAVVRGVRGDEKALLGRGADRVRQHSRAALQYRKAGVIELQAQVVVDRVDEQPLVEPVHPVPRVDRQQVSRGHRRQNRPASVEGRFRRSARLDVPGSNDAHGAITAPARARAQLRHEVGVRPAVLVHGERPRMSGGARAGDAGVEGRRDSEVAAQRYVRQVRDVRQPPRDFRVGRLGVVEREDVIHLGGDHRHAVQRIGVRPVEDHHGRYVSSRHVRHVPRLSSPRPTDMIPRRPDLADDRPRKADL
jgi:hypothetical protein